MTTTIDIQDLRNQVTRMYERVAVAPEGEFHFEMGRPMAERLGYSPASLDRVPQGSIASFAGVGHHFDLAELAEGEIVLDLGSGAGLDTFVAALEVGPTGAVIGVDMCDAQRAKAERLSDASGFGNITYVPGFIETPPVASASVDCVISNGVINLAPDKHEVFRAIADRLRPGGRLALSDIMTESQLPEGIVCNTTLWAACIGGAMQRDAYVEAIEAAGLTVRAMKENHQYRFLSDNAQGATQKYGVKSYSLVATKNR